MAGADDFSGRFWRGLVVWRRNYYAGGVDFGRDGRFECRDAEAHAICFADFGSGHFAAFLRPALRDRPRRCYFRSGDGVVVFNDWRSGREGNHSAARRLARDQPASCDSIFCREWDSWIHRAGGSCFVCHRRGSVVCGHGALWAEADEAGVVLVGLPGAITELLWAGRAAAQRSHRKSKSVLLLGAALDALSVGGPRHFCRRHRIASADLWRILTDDAGDSSRLLAAYGDRSHLNASKRPDLHAARELDTDDRLYRAGSRL